MKKKKNITEQLDQLFDEAITRMEKPQPLVDAYKEGPLASDHMMLSKSWLYFNKRVKSLEAQYKDLMKSKDDTIRALKKSQEIMKTEIDELKERKKSLEEFESSVVEQRTQDYFELRKNMDTIRQGWQVERVTLEQKIKQLETLAIEAQEQRKTDLKKNESNRTGLRKRIEELNDIVDKMKQEKIDLVKESEKRLSSYMEESGTQTNKVDILRAELEERDQEIQKMEADRRELNRKIDGLSEETLTLVKKIHDRDQQLKVLKERFDIVTKEKDEMQNSWTHEQSQWRELWDRQRDLWDKK